MSSQPPSQSMIVAIAPLAAAIGVFGIVYGAISGPVVGRAVTLASSAVIFSGAVQFTIAGLALDGAATVALIAAAALVNSRNLALGAVLRPHLHAGRPARAGLAWFVIDEVVGLALVNRDRMAWTLVVAGSVCYVAWFVGTAVGVLGGSLVPAVAETAGAMFPVLFVALAAMATTSRSILLRAAAAAAVTVAVAVAWPAGRALAPVIAAVVVALPPDRSPDRRATSARDGDAG